MKTPLPPLLAALVTSHNRHDSVAFAACFAHDAVLRDEGREHHGTPAIKAWLDEVSGKYRMVLEVTALSRRGRNFTLNGQVSGAFDGSPIQLRYRVAVDGEKVTSLKIEP